MRRSKRLRKKKTWSEERTEDAPYFQAIVDSTLQDECVGMGAKDSDKALRIGDMIGGGMFGTVYDAELHYRDKIVLHLAVKITLNTGSDPWDKESGPGEGTLARELSDAVIRGETENFLILYGDTSCETAYEPPGLEGYDRAVQIQQWINTAIKYIEDDPNTIESLKYGSFAELPEALQSLFWISETRERDDDFLEGLEDYVNQKVEMARRPDAVRLRLLVMERAKFDILEFLHMTNPVERHDVVGQIIPTARDFVEITDYVHTDLHPNNIMVIQRKGIEKTDYRMVFIDFGVVEQQTNLDARDDDVRSMISEAMNAIWEQAAEADAAVLMEAIDSFEHSERHTTDEDTLIKRWKQLSPLQRDKSVSSKYVEARVEKDKPSIVPDSESRQFVNREEAKRYWKQKPRIGIL